MLISSLADLEITEAHLLCCSFVFAMHSSKYSYIRGPHTRGTKPLHIKDTPFSNDKRQISHHSPSLHLVDPFSIDFFLQKSDKKNKTIMMHFTMDGYIWSAATMAMFLANFPIFTIMLVEY